MNNRCVNCGAELGAPERRDVPYLSLPGVLLCGVEVYPCPSCGEEEIAIPNIEGLNQLLAAWLARRPQHLNGAEIRFLRKVMGWSGRAFALLIGVTPETVSRWENGKEPIGTVAERLLRVLVTQKIEPITDYDAFERWMTRLSESPTEAQGLTEVVRVCHEEGGWETSQTG